LLYGYDSIPVECINTIKGKNEIDDLINRYWYCLKEIASS
jgi:hypothetical protein